MSEEAGVEPASPAERANPLSRGGGVQVTEENDEFELSSEPFRTSVVARRLLAIKFVTPTCSKCSGEGV